MLFHGKPVENRKWFTKYRGNLLIHASKNWDRMAKIVLFNMGILIPPKDTYVYGALIGRVKVVDCVRHHPSEFFFGPYGLVFENQVEFKEPIPYPGQLGIFEVPDEILKGMI